MSRSYLGSDSVARFKTEPDLSDPNLLSDGCQNRANLQILRHWNFFLLELIDSRKDIIEKKQKNDGKCFKEKLRMGESHM